jgi:hypothetical protein
MAGAGSKGGSDDQQEHGADGRGAGSELPFFRRLALRAELVLGFGELAVLLLFAALLPGDLLVLLSPAEPSGTSRGTEGEQEEEKDEMNDAGGFHKWWSFRDMEKAGAV